MKAWIIVISVIVAASSISGARADILIGVPLDQDLTSNQTERIAAFAVAQLNAKGGLLGEQVSIVVGLDDCDGEQAVALAKKFVSDGVAFVAGNTCSGAAIPASEVLAEAGILMIAYVATNPMLTERGLNNVFRVCGRDDEQGAIAASYLAKHYADKKIALLHDGSLYVKGLTDETRKELNARGVTEAMYESIEPGKPEYLDLVEKIDATGVDVVYFPGRSSEAGLIIRQARDRGNAVELIGGDTIVEEEFKLVAGTAAEGVRFTSFYDIRGRPEAANLIAALKEQYYEPELGSLNIHAAIDVWAQAVNKAGTLELEAVSKVLRTEQFDTILGKIGFDEKGDVTGYDTFEWYVRQGDTYVPLGMD